MNTEQRTNPQSRTRRWIAIGNGCCSIVAAAVLALGSREVSKKPEPKQTHPVEITIIDRIDITPDTCVRLAPSAVGTNVEGARALVVARRPKMIGEDCHDITLLAADPIRLLENPPVAASVPIAIDTIMLDPGTLYPCSPEVALAAPDSVKDNL